MAFPNHLSQAMALQHFSEQQLGENSSVLRTILPEQLAQVQSQAQSSPTGKPPDPHHHAPPPPPTWLNSAIRRQQGQYSAAGAGPDANFLNLQTNSDSSAAASQASNQWLSRSIFQRNVSDVRDDVQVSNDSIIAAAISHESAADLNNNNNNDNTTNRNNGGDLTESEVAGAGDGPMNWQNARYKAEILAHPLYEQLLSAHVACLRIATPVDQLPRIDAQLAQSQHVVAKYSTLGHGNLGEDKELDQFMTHYVLLLCSFKEQLQQHVRVHAMEAVMACWEIEQSLQSLTGVSPGEGTGATMSDDDDDQVDSDANLFDGSLDGPDSMGFGPLIPTESERSLMERVRQELKHELKQGYNEIYKILEKGSAKRRTAETLLNKQSSRSHSIFSITIHIKECTPEGEEMIKCGKLNLVDLAGSENISRSGAREGRAREAGEINKSLLTLGRVINALVEHSGHVPYRDSKLTRLLRESLGGKTKTCIIATISPSIHCLEETLNTLDYAHRAKNIKNKPEINQKMMKSAMIKDLYSEIDRLKQEVYAAREKNGIYIPRDRYLQDEAEKKAMAEKIERMELDSESKDKQLAELQELYKSEQQLTAELGDRLDKTEKKLQETEHALADLEERYRQANVTIKEKEYLISNLLKSERSLIEQAFELRSELENATSDVSNLFSKIERKDKIEDGNRILIQKFQSQLTQQLDILHKTVAASATQQEQQLKDMEEDMQFFVSTKTEATEELRMHLEKLKTMYGSGIKVLDDLAEELNMNSQSTFGHLNSKVTEHSSALGELFKGIASEADTLLNDLQNNLHIQENKLNSFAEQQRQAHSRAVTTTRSISQITVNFFKTLDLHVSKLGQIVEEAQSVNDQKLSDFEKKFEECAANEERQLLEKVAELLAGSNARKKQLVETTINSLRESAVSRTNQLLQEMSTMQVSTSSVRTEWTSYVDKAESHYIEDNAAVENGRKEMEETLQNCSQKAKLGAQQWSNAQESLLNLEKSNVDSVDEIVRGGLDANQTLRNHFSSAVSSALEDADAASKNLLSSIDHSLQLDNDACENLDSMIVPSCGELRELKSGHYHKIVEITENAGKCLLEEYLVDEPSCSTPRRRPYNLPSIGSIEELRTPPFDELLKTFWDGKSSKQANGDVKHIIDAAAHSLRDPRVPLTAIN